MSEEASIRKLVQRWTAAHVEPNENGGFVAYGDWLDLASEFAKMRPSYMEDFERLTNTAGKAAVEDIREFIAQNPGMLENISEHHPVGIVRGLAGLLAETLKESADDAVSFIRVIGEEVMRNGYPAGDRETILANVRREIKRANDAEDAARSVSAQCEAYKDKWQFAEEALGVCRAELETVSKLYDKEVLAHGETDDRAETAERELQQVKEAAPREGRWNAVALAVREIESRVSQLDRCADENAAKRDYSGAASQQKSAVDLHCAVAIIIDSIVGRHLCRHSGFNPFAGDTCERCDWEAARKTRENL